MVFSVTELQILEDVDMDGAAGDFKLPLSKQATICRVHNAGTEPSYIVFGDKPERSVVPLDDVIGTRTYYIAAGERADFDKSFSTYFSARTEKSKTKLILQAGREV